jgi:hypothetical protein
VIRDQEGIEMNIKAWANSNCVLFASLKVRVLHKKFPSQVVSNQLFSQAKSTRLLVASSVLVGKSGLHKFCLR